jgi:hypothetical protein
MKRSKQRRQRIARLFFRKCRILRANVLLASQYAAPIEFRLTGAEKVDSG